MKFTPAFDEVWLVDFEFHSTPGERPAPLCLVAVELKSERLVRHWLGDSAPAAPPYPAGPKSWFVAFYAPAELGCHLALGWPFPTNILDLFTEFRNRTNGLPVPYGNSLLG
ncbi:MAG: DNA polymerase I, partial [Pedosphaera sp. Tous-C6FEB]